MAERMVELLVTAKTRRLIKKLKGAKTYDAFLSEHFKGNNKCA
jgi:hypothetical protein